MAATVPTELQLRIEQVVAADDGRADDDRWHVVIADGTVRIDRDPNTEADVRIVTDRATATGIQAGSVSAQRAFLDGRLRIGGDVQSLMAHRDQIAELGLGFA